MKKIIVAIMSIVYLYGNPPVCDSTQYPRMVCETVYINGKAKQECKWVCIDIPGMRKVR
jgi:hypothetical protein